MTKGSGKKKKGGAVKQGRCREKKRGGRNSPGATKRKGNVRPGGQMLAEGEKKKRGNSRRRLFHGICRQVTEEKKKKRDHKAQSREKKKKGGKKCPFASLFRSTAISHLRGKEDGSERSMFVRFRKKI